MGLETNLQKKYSELSADDKNVLHVKSLIFGCLDKVRFLGVIKSLKLRKSDGKAFSYASLNSSLINLAKLGFLDKFIYGCNMKVIHIIARDAVKNPKLQPYLQNLYPGEIFQSLPKLIKSREKQLTETEDVLFTVHFLIHAGLVEHLEEIPNEYLAGHYIDNLMKVIRAIFTGIRIDIVKSFSKEIQLYFCLSKLYPNHMLGSVPDKSLLLWIKLFKSLNHQPKLSYIRYLCAVTNIFLGEKQQTLDTNNTLDDVDANKLNGLLYYLEGNYQDAAYAYNGAIKEYKKITKNNNAIFSDFNLIFMLLTIIETDGNLREYLSVLNSMVENELIFFLKGIICKILGKPASSEVFIKLNLGSYSTNNIFAFICYLWLVHLEQEQPQIKKWMKTIKKLQQAYHGIYPLFEHLFLEILFIQNPSDYANLLESSQFSSLKFCRCFKIKALWECKLEEIFKAILPSKNIIAQKTSPNYERRFVWLLDIENFDNMVSVAEQRLQKNGHWSKGRMVSVKKLYEEIECFEHLDHFDEVAVKALKRERIEWFRDAYVWDMKKLLLSLIGCPRVYHYNNRDVPIELVSGNLMLFIDELDENQYILKLSHYPSDGFNKLCIEQETQNRYRLIDFSEQALNLVEIISIKGLVVPKVAKDNILLLIKENDSNIQIQANISGAKLPEIPADPTICVHLFPKQEELMVELGVRPFGEIGPFYKVAQGAENLIEPIVIDGVKINHQTKRNFLTEKEELQKLLQSCPLLMGSQKGKKTIVNLENCLELVEQIENYQPLKVEWPQGKTFHIKHRLSAKNLSLNIRGTGNNWFEYDGEVNLNEDEVLKMENLLSMLEDSNGRFLRFGDGEYISLTDSFKKQLQELRAMSEKNKLFNLAANSLEDLANAAREVKIDAAWKKHLKKCKDMANYKTELPKNLQAKLRDYQKEGFNHLARLAHWGVGVCLADDMGLGKTVQTIALLLDQSKFGPALVIAPTSVCFNWTDELSKFSPSLNISTLHDVERDEFIDNMKQNDVLICSYGLLVNSSKALQAKVWRTVVLDEAQAIKNHQTKRWQVVSKLQAHCRVALTGTPIENHLGELWSIFRFLNPGLLGTLLNFQKRFANPIEKFKNELALQGLKKLVKPYILRRLKTEVLKELPQKTEQTIIIEPSEEEIAFYEALRKKALDNVSKIKISATNKRFSILAEIAKLRQACCHHLLIEPDLSLPNSKMNFFIETINKLIENQHKVLVFSQYVRYLKLISGNLEKNKINYQYIDGQTTAKQRKKKVLAFQDGIGDVFLLSLKAGGTGVNLTAADYVIHLDPWWNPAVEDQASDRAYRIGQDKPVTIYRFVVKNTIEEKIVKMHQRKRDLATGLLSGAEISGKLSEEELIALM